MSKSRIAFPFDSKNSLDWTAWPESLPNEEDSSAVSQVKQFIESRIEKYPGVFIGSALCLGLCIGWLIKRR